MCSFCRVCQLAENTVPFIDHAVLAAIDVLWNPSTTVLNLTTEFFCSFDAVLIAGRSKFVSNRFYRYQKVSFHNQSRICGKGVGLGLFPSDSIESQEISLESYGQFKKNEKKIEK